LKIYYAIFYPFLHFVFAIGLSALILFANITIGRPPEIFESLFIVILIIRGFLFIRIPYFELLDHTLVIYNRFGKHQKSYPFDSIENFIIENNKVYIDSKGKVRKVRISRMFVSKSKWDEFLAFLKSSDLKKELH
jgi:hypothetical protein